MAILGSDATGRFALGQIRQVPSLVAVAGSYTLTGGSATFSASETATAGSFALTGIAANDTVLVPEPAGVYVFNGVAATFKIAAAETPASYSIAEVRYFVRSGLDALGSMAVGQITPGVQPPFGENFALVMPASGSAIAWTSGNNVLLRTGGDFDEVYGGVGHYLEEIERAKQLAKITRKTPAPIVQAPAAPLLALPSAMVAPQPPAINLGAIATQRMAAQQAQAEQARILKRRRQEAEILLLAS